MKLHISSILSITLLFFIIACSGSQETTENTAADDQEIYIFDDVSEADSTAEVPVVEIANEAVPIDTVETIVSRPNEHIVQVGAYTTEERAKRFLTLNQPKIEWKMKISYSTKVELWVVQLTPFKTRSEAETVRNKLWLMPTFQDAFIVPVD